MSGRCSARDLMVSALMSTEQPAFDPERALSVLNDHGVRYVVIGGIAAAAHGSPMLTSDLDVCYARDDSNLRALANALVALNARLRDAPQGLPFQLDHLTLRHGDHFTFVTDAGDLDVLATPAGTAGYDQLVSDASAIELGGNLEVRIASLDLLIRMKVAAGRPKDLFALETLRAIRDEANDS
jgi:predicted nucleotidyltransferase